MNRPYRMLEKLNEAAFWRSRAESMSVRDAKCSSCLFCLSPTQPRWRLGRTSNPLKKECTLSRQKWNFRTRWFTNRWVEENSPRRARLDSGPTSLGQRGRCPAPVTMATFENRPRDWLRLLLIELLREKKSQCHWGTFLNAAVTRALLSQLQALPNFRSLHTWWSDYCIFSKDRNFKTSLKIIEFEKKPIFFGGRGHCKLRCIVSKPQSAASIPGCVPSRADQMMQNNINQDAPL